jgi:hypothetical protein
VKSLKDVVHRRKSDTVNRYGKKLDLVCRYPSGHLVHGLSTVARAVVRRNHKCLQANGEQLSTRVPVQHVLQLSSSVAIKSGLSMHYLNKYFVH